MPATATSAPSTVPADTRSVAMLGTDTHNDVSPPPYPNIGNALHVVGLVAMGLWLIDNGNLEELARACAPYRRWELMLTWRRWSSSASRAPP